MTREEVQALLESHRDTSPWKQKYYTTLIDLMTTIPLHSKCETASVIAGLLEELEATKASNARMRSALEEYVSLMTYQEPMSTQEWTAWRRKHFEAVRAALAKVE